MALCSGLAVAVAAGCVVSSGDEAASDTQSARVGIVAIPREPQRTSGDPARGYELLVNGGYISVGLPWAGFSRAMSPLEARDALPGRQGKNALVGYAFNVSKNSRGIEVASPNCLVCHATHLNGKLVVGLGRPQHTRATPSGTASDDLQVFEAGNGLSAAEYDDYDRFVTRYFVGLEAGDFILFGAQAAHRDPATLSWAPSSHFDASTGLQGWVDVPAWWRVKKKNALYANGMGRGDFVHHLMNMSIFSVDDNAEAKKVEAMFVDIAAYIMSIEPPKYPGPVDVALSTKGEAVFAANCSTCHGTYGANGSYPNLLVPLDTVGTDPQLATKSWVNDAAIGWWAASFYGQGARFERSAGYMPTPLDGIWATAPFFHNGSVPTLEGVLDSSKRPTTWSTSFGDDAYDLTAIGWKSGPGDVYDTARPGLSNAGHTYGDALDAGDRLAVLEYLKTL